MSNRKFLIKHSDMTEEMGQYAIHCAIQAIEISNKHNDIAAYIKKEFDNKYNPTWHCFVGGNFGCNFTHESRHMIYFSLSNMVILLFKSG